MHNSYDFSIHSILVLAIILAYFRIITLVFSYLSQIGESSTKELQSAEKSQEEKYSKYPSAKVQEKWKESDEKEQNAHNQASGQRPILTHSN